MGLVRGVVVDTERNVETFFNQPRPVPVATPRAAATYQAQLQQRQQLGGGGKDGVQDSAEELPPVIQDIVAHGGNNHDADDYVVAA